MTGFAWPAGVVLAVHDANARWPGPGNAMLRTASATLEQSFFIPTRSSIRLDRPLIVSAGRWHATADGDRLAVAMTGPGRVELRAEALHVATEARSDEAASFRAVEAAWEPTTVHGPVSGHIGQVVLPIAGWPVAEQTLVGATFRAAATGSHRQPAIAITQAKADWLGVTIRASGTLSAPGGRLAGSLSVTVGPGWRKAVMRAARDGAITHPEAQAAVGLLALLGHAGSAPALPLAIDAGRVTLAGLLLIRLPDLPPFSSASASLP